MPYFGMNMKECRSFAAGWYMLERYKAFSLRTHQNNLPLSCKKGLDYCVLNSPHLICAKPKLMIHIPSYLYQTPLSLTTQYFIVPFPWNFLKRKKKTHILWNILFSFSQISRLSCSLCDFWKDLSHIVLIYNWLT